MNTEFAKELELVVESLERLRVSAGPDAAYTKAIELLELSYSLSSDLSDLIYETINRMKLPLENAQAPSELK